MNFKDLDNRLANKKTVNEVPSDNKRAHFEKSHSIDTSTENRIALLAIAKAHYPVGYVGMSGGFCSEVRKLYELEIGCSIRQLVYKELGIICTGGLAWNPDSEFAVVHDGNWYYVDKKADVREIIKMRKRKTFGRAPKWK